ncbi:3-phosphoshikimate 1-carboxyvinyltransferase [Halobacillus mangrovi]|uniref:3-phosphoshikimate 1-carboxyvinyltransferase n=1 Tax=Halobacillus mangrovi TaxID=402384 RepID=UPI003D99F6C1
MAVIEIEPSKGGLSGTLEVPGDKSISHRSVIFASLAEGTSKVSNFLTGEDCLRTVNAFRSLGVEIEQSEDNLVIHGKGVDNLNEPVVPINFGNSGTTARLMSGVLAGLPLFTVAYGDASLSTRPMDRVVVPLKEMGAAISGRQEASLLPLSFEGTTLRGKDHKLKVRSAQVKSSLLLAGLLAEGETSVTELGKTRNHTEMLLPQFGVDLSVKDSTITIKGGQRLKASDVHVPGDISSAAFFIVAAVVTPGSELTLKNVGLNPTRDGIIRVMKAMGASIETNIHTYVGKEPVGDVHIKSSTLTGTTIEGEMIPNVIDEIPIIALAATQAEGTTVIKDAEELRYKETDRISAVVDNLNQLGAHVEARQDGLVIHGGSTLNGGTVDSLGDHRIGMMGAVASLISETSVTIVGKECINISYPSFFSHLDKIRK